MSETAAVATAPAPTKVNRSEVVRRLLREVGAISKNPPSNWRKQVEEGLAKENVTVSTVTIYNARQKLLTKKANKSQVKTEAKTNTAESAVNLDYLQACRQDWH